MEAKLYKAKAAGMGDIKERVSEGSWEFPCHSSNKNSGQTIWMNFFRSSGIYLEAATKIQGSINQKQGLTLARTVRVAAAFRAAWVTLGPLGVYGLCSEKWGSCCGSRAESSLAIRCRELQGILWLLRTDLVRPGWMLTTAAFPGSRGVSLKYQRASVHPEQSGWVSGEFGHG